MLTMSLFMSSFILSWNYVSQNQYSDPTTWPTIKIPLEFNFTYLCHIQGMLPFHIFMLTEVHMLQPPWCIAKMVSGAHRLKILLKISAQFPLPKTFQLMQCFVLSQYIF